MSSRQFMGIPALADVNIQVKQDSYEDNEPTPYRVLVRNFPLEANETDLKALFSKVGSITMFKIVEPGVGLAYFREVESTYEAVKELDEYGGTLSVELDLQKSSEPAQDGEISRAVASLPPEQMFELMKQMKLCILNNPSEARSMLYQNPQLSYALLQAQVIMRIIDCESALDLLKQSQRRLPPTISKPQSASSSLASSSTPFRDPRDSDSSSERKGSFEASAPSQPPPPPRQRRDPRGVPPPRDPRNRDPRAGNSSSSPGAPPVIPPALQESDPEKAALIMQVFQLTNEQIASLPYEQRMSIMELKKQLHNSKSM